MGRRPRPHDADVPHLDRPADAEARLCRPAPRAAASELVGVHGHVDAAHASLQAAWPHLLALSPTSSRTG
jgi:hypothetical protein